MAGRLRLARLLAALLVLSLAAAARAQGPSPPALQPLFRATLPDTRGVPAAVPLMTGWSYRTDARDQGTGADWGSDPPASGWTGVTLPHLFDRKPDPSTFDGTVGWYRLRFRAPAARAGFSWAVRFDQVRRTAAVWLNGREIGTHSDPYVPFALPASGLRPGVENELVVRVDNRKGAEPREGWWNWGGIPRPVTLVPRGTLGLRSPGLMSQTSCDPGGADCRATLDFDGTLVNRGTTAIAAPAVTIRLTPPAGGQPLTFTRSARALPPGGESRLRFAVTIPGARLWSPTDPQRYTAAIVTSAGGAATQLDTKRIGLRGISVVNGELELNGRQLDLRGASIQEDAAGVGPALSDADIARIVRDLKAVHANVTRAHYLLNEKLLDAFDAAGILVWSQAPIYHRDLELQSAAGRAQALDTLRGTILAARSHPSVLTNSVANELSPTPDTTPGTKAYLDAARAVAQDLDPEIPVAVDLLSYPDYPAAAAYRQYPLIGINSYFGWYRGKADHSTAKLTDLGPYLDRMRRMYPTSAMVVTEFGAESTHGGPASEKQTYAFQSDYIRRVLKVVAARPFMSGAIYWTLREFAVKPNWYGGADPPGVPRDAIHNKGLETYAGVRKPAFAVAARAFAATPEFPVMSQGQMLGSPLPPSRHRRLPLEIALGALALLIFAAALIAGIRRRRRRRRDRDGDEPPADGLAAWPELAPAPSAAREEDRVPVRALRALPRRG